MYNLQAPIAQKADYNPKLFCLLCLQSTTKIYNNPLIRCNINHYGYFGPLPLKRAITGLHTHFIMMYIKA